MVYVLQIYVYQLDFLCNAWCLLHLINLKEYNITVLHIHYIPSRWTTILTFKQKIKMFKLSQLLNRPFKLTSLLHVYYLSYDKISSEFHYIR